MIRMLSVLLGLALTVGGQTYQLDSARSSASFTARHMMVTNVTGRLSNVTGTIVYDPKDLAKSSVTATIDATTINTNEDKRDRHLKGPDFLDIAKFPTMSFISTRVYLDAGLTKVDGNLTIHGVTKPVTLTLSRISPEVKVEAGQVLRGATATTKISRQAFALRYNKLIETGGVVVGDEILITLELESVRQPG